LNGILQQIVDEPSCEKKNRINMRALAGFLAFLAIVMIAVLMLVYEWIRKRKNKS